LIQMSWKMQNTLKSFARIEYERTRTEVTARLCKEEIY
jgi:hypothetical protein